jgi:Domain of unknown function (DUF4173)
MQKAGHPDMTSITTPLPDLYPGERHPAGIKFAFAIALVILADWLFYDQREGISVVLFAVALMCGSLAANFGGLDRTRAVSAAAIFLAGLLPAVEDLNLLSFAVVIVALATGIAVLTNPNLKRLRDWWVALRDLLLIGPFRSIADAAGLLNLAKIGHGLVLWLVPLAFGGIFIFLFASANPLIEKWLLMLAPGGAASQISTGRILFWVAASLMIWPFLKLRWRRGIAIDLGTVNPDAASPEAPPQNPGERQRPRELSDLFGAPTILRSLILFNLMFAVQTGLDLIYLWGDGTLPADISYADYAHRGAYPLIVTALLAASFVLTTMRPGGPAEASRIIRPLVYLWVAQTIMLVLSSIQRLHLYVEVYQLTYWRLAALIWMLLVAVGLVLIVARIALKRSDGWLIRANLVSLAGTLYVCMLINFTAVIADYNVSHSREAGGQGVGLDMYYLFELGPQALPAIDKACHIIGSVNCLAYSSIGLLETQQRQVMASWRNWSYRGFRLQRYLDGPRLNARWTG